MHTPTAPPPYPISLSEDLSKARSGKARRIALVLAIISAGVLMIGIFQGSTMTMIVAAILLFIFIVATSVWDTMDDATTLVIDAEGIAVHSRKNESKRISLNWDSITSIHHGWQSPQADAQKFNRLLSDQNGLIPFSIHDRSSAAVATICYKLPKRPEWREGRELRAYQFTQTFGMSQQDFFDFLTLHFERNKRAQL